MPMPRFMFILALFIMPTNTDADEFADVDPERLAKGIEILAAKWTIPIVTFHGATDDFAKSIPTKDKVVPTKRAFPVVSKHYVPTWACLPSYGGILDRLRYGAPPDCISGAITRRRD